MGDPGGDVYGFQSEGLVWCYDCIAVVSRLFCDCFVSCRVLSCLALWLSCLVLRSPCLILPSLILAFVIFPLPGLVVLNMVEVAFLRPRVGLCALMAEVFVFVFCLLSLIYLCLYLCLLSYFSLFLLFLGYTCHTTLVCLTLS